ncbi:MAG: acetate/propionate family kinase [bacterium]
MNILIINAGSTSIKFRLFSENQNNLQELLSGIIDQKADSYFFKLTKAGASYEWEVGEFGFGNAAGLILKELNSKIIDKIGFRIVHGGEEFRDPIKLNTTVLKKLEKLSDLAPLHNPPALKRIAEFQKVFPEVPIYGVFDTAFHKTIPEKAFLYALPYEYYKTYQIRRFGFHGISHQFVSSIFQKLEPQAQKVISCHLGGGASMTAILEGQSIDTSMGFTPLEGLIMATRPGDIDDGAIHYLMGKLHYEVKDMQHLENEESGLKGISGITGDLRQLIELEKQGNTRAKLAIDMYVYRIQKYIGSYAAALNGVDGLIFTAGVGAGSDYIRSRIISGLEFLNLRIAPQLNQGKINVAENLKISTQDSAPIWVIPTNEELQIAREIRGL